MSYDNLFLNIVAWLDFLSNEVKTSQSQERFEVN